MGGKWGKHTEKCLLPAPRKSGDFNIGLHIVENNQICLPAAQYISTDFNIDIRGAGNIQAPFSQFQYGYT
ncbi:MAG: hypothetical protein DUD27_08885 [Lachnospiraceae bacterium]|nr:MAG: hypothetical protein DUD27_08885 [Lachnospiraceae bacterium]